MCELWVAGLLGILGTVIGTILGYYLEVRREKRKRIEEELRSIYRLVKPA